MSNGENISVPGTISNDNGTTIVASPYMVVPYNTNAADFNMDGKLDVATANNSYSDISILLGDGLGGFLPSTNVALSIGSYPFSIVSWETILTVAMLLELIMAVTPFFAKTIKSKI